MKPFNETQTNAKQHIPWHYPIRELLRPPHDEGSSVRKPLHHVAVQPPLAFQHFVQLLGEGLRDPARLLANISGIIGDLTIVRVGMWDQHAASS